MVHKSPTRSSSSSRTTPQPTGPSWPRRASCFLTGHEGTISFATGTLAGDLNGPFNDQDFDVSVHLVFVNKAALDKYHEHPRHQKFVDENKDNWEKVRVFDSYLSTAPRTPGAAPVSQ